MSVNGVSLYCSNSASIYTVQSEQMATIVNMRKPLTTYYRSLEVFTREMSGSINRVQSEQMSGRFTTLQSEQMATIVDMRNTLTTYYHSLQVFTREMRAYIYSHNDFFVASAKMIRVVTAI